MNLVCYFTGEVCGAVVLSAVDGRSWDWFSIGGDTPAVPGGIVALFVGVAAVCATTGQIYILTSSLLCERQTSLLRAPTPTRPLYIYTITTNQIIGDLLLNEDKRSRAGFRGSPGGNGPPPVGAPTKINVVLISPVRLSFM